LGAGKNRQKLKAKPCTPSTDELLITTTEPLRRIL
jgi:hypothetical protein